MLGPDTTSKLPTQVGSHITGVNILDVLSLGPTKACQTTYSFKLDHIITMQILRFGLLVPDICHFL